MATCGDKTLSCDLNLLSVAESIQIAITTSNEALAKAVSSNFITTPVHFLSIGLVKYFFFH